MPIEGSQFSFKYFDPSRSTYVHFILLSRTVALIFGNSEYACAVVG